MPRAAAGPTYMVSPVLATWQRNWSRIGHTSFFPLFSKSVGVRTAQEERKQKRDKKKCIKNRNQHFWTISTTPSETSARSNNASADPNSSSNFPALGIAKIFSRGETRAPGRQKLVRDFWEAAAGPLPSSGPGRAGPTCSGQDGSSRGGEGRGSAGRSAGRGQPGGLRAQARPSPSLQRTPGRRHPRDPAPPHEGGALTPGPAPGGPTPPLRAGTPLPAPRRSPHTTFQRLLQPLDVHDPRPRPRAALRAAPLRRPPPTPRSKRAPGAARTDTARAQQPSNMAPGPSPCAAPTARPPSRRGGVARGGRGRAGPEGGGKGREGAVRTSPQAGRRCVLDAGTRANRRESCGKFRTWGTLTNVPKRCAF